LQQQPWVSVGGSWRDEENVCGYWRFSEGNAVVRGLQEGEEVEMKDLSKFGSVAMAKGRGLRFEETSSPVDPGDKGKVAEAVDVCYPEEVRMQYASARTAEKERRTAVSYNGGVKGAGGYKRGVFVGAARGSSIDIGLFHDDQRRSVATVEMWVHAGEKPIPAEKDAGTATATATATALAVRHEQGDQETPARPSKAAAERRFRQQFHVLACRVSTSGEHVWSLVVENNGQVAFIPGPVGRRDLGPGFSNGGESEDGGGVKAKIAALKEAVYTEADAFPWDKWTHVAVTMDTSRDESSAEVRLFLDGLRVGLGTCRFNKVPQFSMSETWMVLGPDLVGWKLTEARIWAMLRDEDSLQARQDWKENSLALAETKKARLVIRAPPKVKDSTSNPRMGMGSIASGRLAPPPGPSSGNPARRRLVGGLTPPQERVSGDAGLRGIPAPPGSAMKDSRKIRPVSGFTLAAAHMRPPVLSTSRDPRKAALAAKQLPSGVSAGPTVAKQQRMGAVPFAAPALPLNFAAFSTAPGGGPAPLLAEKPQAQLKDAARVAVEPVASMAQSTPWHQSSVATLATPEPVLNFASFSAAPGGDPVRSPVGEARLNEAGGKTKKLEIDSPKAVTEVVVGTEAATKSPDEGVLRGSGREAVTGTSSLSPLTRGGASAEGANSMPTPAPVPKGAMTGAAAAAAAEAEVAVPTLPPPVDSLATSANAWANFGERRESGGGRGVAGLERRFSGITISSATLATPTNSDVSSVMTPSSSRSPWAEDFPSVPMLSVPSPATRAAGAVSGGGLFSSKLGEDGGAQATVVQEGKHVPVSSDGQRIVREAPRADCRPVDVESGIAGNGATVHKVMGEPVSDTISTLPTTTNPGKEDNDVSDEVLASSESSRQDGTIREDETAGVTQEGTDEKETSQVMSPEAADEVKRDPPSSSTDAAAGDLATLRAKGNLLQREGLGEKDPGTLADHEPTGPDKDEKEDLAHGQPKDHPEEASSAAAVSISPFISSEKKMPGSSCGRDVDGSVQAHIDLTPADYSAFEALTARKLGGTTPADNSRLAEITVDKGEQATSHETDTASNVPSFDPTSVSSGTPTATSTTMTKVACVEDTAGSILDTPSAESMVPSSTAAPENIGGGDVTSPSHPSGVTSSVPPMPSTTVSRTVQKVDSVHQRLDSRVDPTLTPPKGSPENAEKGNAEKPGQPQGTKSVSGASAGSSTCESAGGIRSIVLAGPEGVFSIAEAAESHLKSPLLGASGTFVSMASKRGKLATVAVVDLWNEGATTRYPIGCLSAILSPRTDEQVIALLSEGGMQVFSVTQRIRRRHEPMKASDVRLWKWMTDDMIVIVTKTAVLSWDVRGTSMPKELFARHRPDSSSHSMGADGAFDYRATADGRRVRPKLIATNLDTTWGLLFVADKEHLCDGCRDDPVGSGDCACETSLMLDLHDFGGTGATRCFRALGAALVDIPKSPASDAIFVTTSATAPSREGFAWDEPLLAAVVPDAKTGLNVLQLLRLGVPEDDGSDDHYLCSVTLQEDGQQPTERRRIRKSLRESKLPAVPFRILTWRPAPGVDLLAVVTLAGGITVFKIEPEEVALKFVSHDGQAFPGGVVGVEEDCVHGDMVVLSAGVGEGRSWVVSRASSAVVGR
ncbi:unnamed protein product, partial [Hapterophycus canaliculatus]